MSGRSWLMLGLVAAMAVAMSACGRTDTPVRLGILVECGGLFAPTAPGALAGASLPLLERGATKGDRPGELENARVAGRRVELIPACTEVTKFSQLIAETRRLVESRGADIVVGPLGTPDGPVLRELARRYPDVTFLAGPGLAQEVTLKNPQPNLFRLTPDGAQIVAGLGEYAYRDLGWRRAVVVSEGYTNGWEITAGFVAEFCALGGEIVERDYQSLFAPDPSAAAKRHAEAADGVALLMSALSPVAYLQAYGTAVGSDLERRLVVAGPPFYDQGGALAPPGVDTTGVVIGGFIPLDPDDEAMQAFRAALEHAYPELVASVATQDPTFSSYAAVEAVATALEASGGELGDGQAELRRVLSSLELDLPYGPVRFDANRQAVVRTSLERIRRRADGQAEVDLLRHVTESSSGSAAASTRRPRRRPGPSRPASAPHRLPGRDDRQPAIVQVKRVSAPRGARPPGRMPRRTRMRRAVRARRERRSRRARAPRGANGRAARGRRGLPAPPRRRAPPVRARRAAARPPRRALAAPPARRWRAAGSRRDRSGPTLVPASTQPRVAATREPGAELDRGPVVLDHRRTGRARRRARRASRPRRRRRMARA